MKFAQLILVFLLFMVLFSCTQKDKEIQYEFIFPSVKELPVQNILPDPFIMYDGSRVTTLKDWENQRKYLKAMLIHYQYGEMPPKPEFTVVKVDSNCIMDGQCIEQLMKMIIKRNGKTAEVRFGIHRPNKPGRYPVIVKNDRFRFNLDDIRDETIRQQYSDSYKYPVEQIVAKEALKRDYVICKFIRDDVADDIIETRNTGVFPLYPEYDFATIAAWAWFYQPLIDYLINQDYIDSNRIVATGHSRGGKTALAAGIFDERIAVTVPNSSGTGGTGSWKYFDSERKPQNIKSHIGKHDYWWVNRIFDFAENDSKLPFDSHFHRALIAPRALLNPHARQDYWANPYGTYLTYLAAHKVFDWMGVPENNAIHWRQGGHGQLEEDWLALFDYCDLIFFNKPTNQVFNAPHDPEFKDNPKYENWPSLWPWEAPPVQK